MKIKKIYFFSNYLFIIIFFKYLQCSLNILTLQFCRCDISALPTPVLNFATFMYKHLKFILLINVKMSHLVADDLSLKKYINKAILIFICSQNFMLS